MKVHYKIHSLGFNTVYRLKCNFAPLPSFERISLLSLVIDLGPVRSRDKNTS